MLLADFLGYNSDDWEATLGLVGVFFIFFPLLVHGLVVFIIAQVLGERRENHTLAHGESVDPSQG